MKILHLTSYFFPEYSGTTTRLYHLLSRLPFEVRIITSDKTMKGESIVQKREQFGNITVDRTRLEPEGLLSRTPLRYFHTFYRKPDIFARVARQHRFDIVHVHTICKQALGNIGRQISREFKKPFILEIHAIEREYLAGLSKSIKRFYIDSQTKKLLACCDRVITLTETLKAWLCQCYQVPRNKVTVIPNGVDITHFTWNFTYELRALRLKQNLGINGRVVLYAGYMDKLNGIDDLVSIIPEIIQKRDDIVFAFIGHGPGKKKLTVISRRYPKNVRLLSPVPYLQMPVYYQMCDLFVIPRPSTISTETLTPLKLLEAMAMGKLVLGSNVGGIAEIVKNKENGYLFEKGDMDDFSKTLLDALGSDNAQIGENARRTVSEHHTWDRSVHILQKIYEELAYEHDGVVGRGEAN